jgi:hypothetical protein
MSQTSELNNAEVIYDEDKISDGQHPKDTSPNTPQILQSDKRKDLISIETIVPR